MELYVALYGSIEKHQQWVIFPQPNICFVMAAMVRGILWVTSCVVSMPVISMFIQT